MKMRLFISYSHKDDQQVQHLVSRLQAAEFDVWIDRHSIQAGEQWRNSIVQGIETCDAFIVVLTPNSIESQNVVKEVSLAEERNKRIFPLIGEPCNIPPSMAYQLSGLQHLHIHGANFDTGTNQLIAALNGAPAPQQPASSQTPPQPHAQQPPPFSPVGVWNIHLQHPFTGLIAQGQFTLAPNGEFRGGLTTNVATIEAQGHWQHWGAQLMLQGSHINVAMPHYAMPYAFGLQITNYGEAGFQGITSVGEQVTFHRIG